MKSLACVHTYCSINAFDAISHMQIVLPCVDARNLPHGDQTAMEPIPVTSSGGVRVKASSKLSLNKIRTPFSTGTAKSCKSFKKQSA